MGAIPVSVSAELGSSGLRVWVKFFPGCSDNSLVS